MPCDLCDLANGCETNCMEPDESGLVGGRCDVMIIGEAPGHDEDIAGVPFVGASGTLLRMVVEDSGLDEFGIVYTNVVRCRPPGNAAPSAKQVKICVPRLMEEITHYDPAMVILLGNVPLKAVLGETGITAWRGSKLERDGRTYIPTFHPAYVLRNNVELPTLLTDIQSARDLLAGSGKKSIISDYEVCLVVGEADSIDMYNAIKEAGTVAFDTESVNNKPYQTGVRMIMLSFAINKPTKRAWAVLPDDDRVARRCRQILQDPEIRKIGHNMKYDQHVVWTAWGIEMQGIVGDSMLASWMLDPTPGRHGLKHLAGRILSLYEYNAELDAYHAQHPESDPNKGGDQSLVPVDVLAPYAAIDAISTLEVHRRLYKQLSPIQKTLYNELIIPASAALWRMEMNGVALDDYIVDRYIRVYSKIQGDKLEDLMADRIVQKYIRDRQAQIQDAFDEKYAGRNTRAKCPTFHFNPNSNDQMKELLFGRRYLRLKPLAKTDKGEPSTRWDNLKAYANDNPFLQSYRYYKLLGKMLSTYLKPALDWRGGDGLVRSNYNIHGTVSGRLSSSEPNLQNIPTPEKEPDTVLAYLPVKNIFTARQWGDPGPGLITEFENLLGPYVSKGGLIMAADYSGMELRTMASVSGCKRMMDIFTSGGDVHRVVSSKIFDTPEDQVTKEMRYKGKWTNWTLLYGGNEWTLQRLYGIPLKDGEHFVNSYYGLFPEIFDFQQEIIAFARENGYVESMLGQRRYLPYINDKDAGQRSHAEREAINHPIQSVASQMLIMALVILNDVIQWNQLQTLMVNTVHDSIMFDLPLYELPIASSLVKQVMEGLTDPELYKCWFPNIDLSWFTCPLVAEIEIGSHYGSLTEYHVKEQE